MKNRIVIWGTNGADEKVLIALELQTEASKVMLYTFPEALATAEFSGKLMKDWREGREVEFPEGYTTIERELSVTEGLLPDDLKVDRTDVIQRAQTEWHFVVLSTKLHQVYQHELAEFKDKIQQLSSYDNKIFDGLKAFWEKVQSQSRDRNLFREHADSLRDSINVLFEDLKKLRSKVQEEFMSASSAVADDFNKALDDIEERITAGGQRLNNVFDELKQLQQRYRTARLSNEHRNQIWDRIDGAFKKAKERKFGAGAADEGNAVERRLAGLVDALKRMEDSVRRDAEELEFQHKKVSKTEGQLEAQIRMAKIKMIEERLESKRAKVEEIKRTMSDLERRSNSAKNKEAKRVEKEAERQKVAAAKDAVKAEIDAEIKTRKEDSLFEAASTMLGDVLMDAIDTAKAVASVTADQVEDAVDVAKDKGADLLEEAAEKGSSLLEKAKELAGIVAEEAEKAFENAVDSVEDVISANSDPEKSAKKGKKATNDTVIVEDTVHTPAPVKENETAADPTKEADQKGATPGE